MSERKVHTGDYYEVGITDADGEVVWRAYAHVQQRGNWLQCYGDLFWRNVPGSEPDDEGDLPRELVRAHDKPTETTFPGSRIHSVRKIVVTAARR